MNDDPLKPIYKRVLLKLSGEAFGHGGKSSGISLDETLAMAHQIKRVAQRGVQLAIVVGGGNLLRGAQFSAGLNTIKASTADYMGMIATVMNGLALQDTLESLDMPTRLMTAIHMDMVCEPYLRRRAIRHLEKGRVVIFGAGTGSPYFTTDSAASLRAIEIEADAVLKGTRVDGIYSADPEKDPTATRYARITFDEVIDRNLAVMDMTAFTLCRENAMPIIVFDMNRPGNLRRVAEGEDVGTLVKN